MYENDPRFLLNEELTSAAFRVHPYHHEVIGDEADLRSMTRDDLYGSLPALLRAQQCHCCGGRRF